MDPLISKRVPSKMREELMGTNTFPGIVTLIVWLIYPNVSIERGEGGEEDRR